MGCNTSQEQAAVSVGNENAATTNVDNDINADTAVKQESNEAILKDSSNQVPMVNGDPLGKDEGESIKILSSHFFSLRI